MIKLDLHAAAKLELCFAPKSAARFLLHRFNLFTNPFMLVLCASPPSNFANASAIDDQTIPFCFLEKAKFSLRRPHKWPRAEMQ